jgi:hypothetical protein
MLMTVPSLPSLLPLEVLLGFYVILVVIAVAPEHSLYCQLLKIEMFTVGY